MNFTRVLLLSIRSFVRDRASIFAASMSFYAIMAIVPFMLFLITVIGMVIGEDPDLMEFVVSKILELFPEATRDITAEIEHLVSYSGFGVLGLIVYAYLSFQFIKSAEFALNAIFKVTERRAIHHSIIVSVSVITFIMLFFTASFSVATLFNPAPFLLPYLPRLEISLITRVLIRFVVPLVLVWLIITLLYVTLPLRRPRLLLSLRASFFVSIMLELAKHLFTWYTAHISKLGHVYGPLTTFMLFFLWVYYASCLFLLGAEMIIVLEESDKEEVYV